MLCKLRKPEPEFVREVLEGEFARSKSLRCLHYLLQILPFPKLEKLRAHPSFSEEMNCFLSFNPHLTLGTIYLFREWHWDWKAISANSAFHWEHVLAHPELPWNGRGLSLNPNITLRDVLSPESRKLSLKWDFDFLSSNPGITFWEVWKHPGLPWNFSRLTKNPNFKREHLLRLSKHPSFKPGEAFWGVRDPPSLKEVLENELIYPPGLEFPPVGLEEIKKLGFQEPFSEKLITFLLGFVPLEGNTLLYLAKALMKLKGIGIFEIGDLLVTNSWLQLRDVLRLPHAERLLKYSPRLLFTAKFTEEELPSLYQEYWNLHSLASNLTANPCFTFECYKKLPDITRGVFKANFLTFNLPMLQEKPFNFPELVSEQWRLYRSLVKGARTELALTYWCLMGARTRVTRKKGKRLGRKRRARELRFPNSISLPVELIALIASRVLGRIHPYSFTIPSRF